MDDHPTFRGGIAALIQIQPDMEVVAEAGDGQSALDSFLRTKPDVVLMDLRMPGMSGVETILALRKDFPEARVIVVTTYDWDEDIYRAMQAGARSCLLKGMTQEELVSTIRAVHAGENKLPASVAGRLAERSLRQELTRRELDALELLTKGRSNKEISSALSISEGAVKYHPIT